MTKAEKREYDIEYRKKNKDRINNRIKLWKQANPEKANAWYHNNKESAKSRNKAWFIANKEKMRNHHLQGKFGMTIEQYNEFLNTQNNCCAICNTPQSNFKQQLAVDHDHQTGKVRGLLCGNCNNGLGRFKDDIEILKKAINYLNS